MSTVQSEIEKQFQFDVKEHAGELLLGFNNARIERRLCDFVIKVGSKEIHVHKIVLSESSPYFRGMFSNKMREKASGFVEIKGVDPECMEICILYFYTGKASMFGSKLQQLLQAADMLQIPRLCEAIGLFFLTNLDPDSFFLTRKVANTFNLPALKEHCDKYAMEKFTSIAMKPDFKELEKEYVSFLIGSKENKACEAAKCKALILWTSSDQENRAKTFEESFQMLQLEKIPADYRLYLSQEEPLIADSAKCLRNLFKSHQAAVGAATIIMKDFPLEETTISADQCDKVEKKKNPWGDLPKAEYDMDEFKRTFSNDKSDSKDETLKYFWDKFDKEKYSIYRGRYKYNDELKLSFMVSNLIEGMFQRIEKMRKHAFGIVAILKKDGKFIIDGIWFWRGPGLAFELDDSWQIDYDTYSWTKLDPGADDTKLRIKEYFTEQGGSL